MIRVFIIEDDKRTRDSWRLIVDGSEGFACVGDCASAEQALAQVPVAKPDVVLQDIRLTRMDGVSCARKLKELWPELRILMLTNHDDEHMILEALEGGASGYILKSDPPAKVLEAIEKVYHGRSALSGAVTDRLVQSFQSKPPPNPDLQKLTLREKELLQAMADKGISTSKQLAHCLGISERTVDAHMRNIIEKLGVESRTDALLKWMRK